MSELLTNGTHYFNIKKEIVKLQITQNRDGILIAVLSRNNEGNDFAPPWREFWEGYVSPMTVKNYRELASTNLRKPCPLTVRNPHINEFVNNVLGADRDASIEAGRCVPAPLGCGKENVKFDNELDAKEFAISGLCKNCQL